MQWRFEAKTQENHKQDHAGPGLRHWSSSANLQKETEEGVSPSLQLKKEAKLLTIIIGLTTRTVQSIISLTSSLVAKIVPF